MSGRPPALSRPACGTESGYTAHRKRRDVPCRACTDAHTAAQRDRAERRRLGLPSIRPVAKCGTPSGYAKHRRRGEAACDGCRAANAAYFQERRKARLLGDRKVGGRPVTAPCGTSASRKRHRRRDEGCAVCWPDTPGNRAVPWSYARVVAEERRRAGSVDTP